MDTHKAFLLMLTAGISVNGTCGSIKAQTQKEKKEPNFFYIFPDQYRLHALGIWSDPEYKDAISTLGDPVHTPNLDKLAKQGVLFTQVCSTFPLSSPHRGMLLSGMYAQTNGLDLNCRIGREQELNHDIECLTDVLAKAGYETAYVGKTHWHKTEAVFDKEGNYIGKEPGRHSISEFDTYIPEGKSRHSNQYWFQHILDNHFNPISYSNRPELIDGKSDGEAYRTHQFSGQKEANIVIQYLENKNNQRDPNKPFSIIWSINPPHPPYYKLSDCDTTIYNQYYKDLPAHELFVRENVDQSVKSSTPNARNKEKQLTARIYFSLIAAIDKEIGRVLQALEETGEADNTLVVFASDHGEMLCSQDTMGKSVIYDESFLTPFIIRYPQKLTHRMEDLMLGTVDIMPTMLGLLGLDNKIPSTVMGRDYSDGILTEKFQKNAKPSSAFYFRNNAKGVRTYQYTYEVQQNGTYQLFDNQKDPYQMNTLTLESIPSKVALKLKSDLGQWLMEAHDNWYDKKTNKKLIIYPQI
ncbi:sulfatase family protein [Bacteroides reticulotermitis]|uniref:Sulfatase N-terminal domain-containing protein n=2 Tax=Bacteroides reticulotermitis TaxID=1133319 RepID=W4URX7_9BACE|nr:sulfatase [Bacteroides reticulotermitis]MBB4043650.1 arylsulfatase A-like enzyme [Bacteroides reticulotermitis]GAE83721.1 hypothetical protein JCM10512_2015 [Bacteroides reticulotermitis JCM 10512]